MDTMNEYEDEDKQELYTHKQKTYIGAYIVVITSTPAGKYNWLKLLKYYLLLNDLAMQLQQFVLTDQTGCYGFNGSSCTEIWAKKSKNKFECFH